MEAVKSSGIHKKCQEAFINSQPLDIVAEIQAIDEQYHRQAVGPAASEVLEKGHRELNQLGDLLKRNPGPPGAVRVIGSGSDRVKLSWQPPRKNHEAAESYVVWKQEKGKQWERVRATKKTKILITGLKSDTYYQFTVTATNDLIKSLDTWESSLTKISKAYPGLTGSVKGGVDSLSICRCFSDMLIEVITEKAWGYVPLFGALSLFDLSLILTCAPLIVRFGAAGGAWHKIKEECYYGDLSPGSDVEMS